MRYFARLNGHLGFCRFGELMRLRSHALIIAAVTLIPFLVFVCFVIILLFQKGRDSQMQYLVETSRALSLAVDRDFDARVSALKALGMAVGGVLLLLMGAYGFAVIYGRRIFNSITALCDAAKKLGSGGVPRYDPSPVVELNEARRELVLAAEQRGRTEAQLRYELQLVRDISDKAAESIFVVDANGLVTFVNPEAEQTFGFSSTELIGQRLHEKIHHHYPNGRPMPRSECTLAQLRLSGGSVRARDDVFFHKDGSPVSVNCTNAPIEVDGAPIGAVLIARDVTETKRAEEMLRKSEASLVEAQARAKLGSWERNLATDVGAWSAEMFRLFGRDSSDGVPTLDEFFAMLHGEDRARVQEAMARAVNTGKQASLEFRSNPSLGPTRHFTSTIYSIENADPRAQRLGGTVQDITERKQLLAEVQRRAEQLVEADRQKDEFLATLAHELRNPLAPITNAVEIVRLQGNPSPELQWATDVIDKQMEHMTRLIDDLLDVSRITRNKLELRKKQVEVAEVVQMAVDTAGPVIEQFGHDLSVELPRESIYLDADPVRLAQVLSNLLNNAAKYTDRGGSINLAVERVEGTVVISIKDSGIGIREDRLSEVFELFSQVDPLLERTQGGLGIGLNLARRLVDMHGGIIEARSEGPGKGSKFIIRLPIAVAASKPEEGISAQLPL
jgi:PAS domain S-box-containing protein